MFPEFVWNNFCLIFTKINNSHSRFIDIGQYKFFFCFRNAFSGFLRNVNIIRSNGILRKITGFLIFYLELDLKRFFFIIISCLIKSKNRKPCCWLLRKIRFFFRNLLNLFERYIHLKIDKHNKKKWPPFSFSFTKN